MTAISHELSLLCHAFNPYYRTASLQRPLEIDWSRFLRLIRNNKLQLLASEFALRECDTLIQDCERVHLTAMRDHHTEQSKKLGPSVEQVKLIMGDTPYAIVKTYRNFPYFTHDVDVLVNNTTAVGEEFTKAGISWDDVPKKSVQVEDSRWLDLEFYERVLPGSIRVIDDDLALRNRNLSKLGGVDTFIAAPEIETLTLIADAVFRLYELKLGDMIYIYSLAELTDWDLLQFQADKYNWADLMEHYVKVLSGYHWMIYGSESPIRFQTAKRVHLGSNPPYVSGWAMTVNALRRNGLRHLVKLPAYLSVRLKQNHLKLHALYVKYIQVPIGGFVLRHLYR